MPLSWGCGYASNDNNNDNNNDNDYDCDNGSRKDDSTYDVEHTTGYCKNEFREDDTLSTDYFKHDPKENPSFASPFEGDDTQRLKALYQEQLLSSSATFSSRSTARVSNAVDDDVTVGGHESVDDDSDDDNTSYTGTEASVPPPPPRLPDSSASHWSSIFKPKPATEHETTIVFDHDTGQTSSFESIDASIWPSYWNNWYATSKSNKDHGGRARVVKRRMCYFLAALVLLCMILGLAIGVSNNNNKDAAKTSTSSSNSLRNGATQTAAPATVTAPTVAPTTNTIMDIDMDMEDPVLETAAPTDCEDVVENDQICYNRADLLTIPILVDFARCDPNAENWVGIFPAGLTPNNLSSDPLLWLWTCNSQALDVCLGLEEPLVQGTLSFGGDLVPGAYEAHLVERDGVAPFLSFRTSAVFFVSDNCDN